MDKRDGELLKRLREMFYIEADERVNIMYSELLQLEKTTDLENQSKAIESILREAHSLKGAARAVNMSNIEKICQSLESALAAIKRKKVALPPVSIDIFHKAVDTVSNLLAAPQEGKEKVLELIKLLDSIEQAENKEKTNNQIIDGQLYKKEQTNFLADSIESNNNDIKIGKFTDAAQQSQQKFSNLDTIRISAAKMDSLLLQAEELLSIKLITNKFVDDIEELKAILDNWAKEWTAVFPEVKALRQYLEKSNDFNVNEVSRLKLAKVLDFLTWNESFIKSVQNKMNKENDFTKKNQLFVSGAIDNLLEDMKKALMLPFSTILESFSRMVRDIGKDKKKEINFIVHGGGIEIDKRILEEIKDPLIHIVRNAIDHGIERPEDRIKRNKPKQGTISIFISTIEGNKVRINISDDGAGIEVGNIKKTVVERKVIPAKDLDNFNDKELLELIFIPEISTSKIITDISGRGLGLAIVKEKIEKLDGHVVVKTDVNIGTTFEITLPVSLSIFRAILVKVSGQDLIIPTKSVEKVARVKLENIKKIEGKESISVDGNLVSVVQLADVLKISPTKINESGYRQLLIINVSDKRMAFIVDEILNEQEVLAKKFGKVLSRVRNVAGATILGSGKVVPILNIFDLMKSAQKIISDSYGSIIKEKSNTGRISVLVVEDSITSRMLLKSILESAGYYVKTATNGIEGFNS